MSSIRKSISSASHNSIQPELVDVELTDQNFFFNLSLTPKTLPDTLLVAGDAGALLELNLWHELATHWHWPMRYASSERTHDLLGSMIVPLHAAQTFIASNAVLGMGYGIHIGSREQLWLEAVLRSQDYSQAYVTAELIPLFVHNPALLQIQGITPVWSVAECIGFLKKLHIHVKAQPGHGLYTVAALIEAMPFASDMVVLYDAERVYVYVRESGKMLHVPRDAAVDRPVFRTILSHFLMAVCSNDRRSGSLEDCARAALQLVASVRSGQSAAEIVREAKTNVDHWAST